MLEAQHLLAGVAFVMAVAAGVLMMFVIIDAWLNRRERKARERRRFMAHPVKKWAVR